VAEIKPIAVHLYLSTWSAHEQFKGKTAVIVK